MLYVESLNLSLHEMMTDSQNVVLIGEDLMDPYGGAFKVSKGLSTNFPLQVLSTPISEHAIVGAAIGMSLRGLTPIVEIMFGDFITLCVDQIVNHAAKYHWMYNELVSVPIVIRIPMGGGRGYGPTHSQSLESLFMSVSGLKICAPSIFHDPGYFLKQSVLHEKHPILFIEDQVSYSRMAKFFVQQGRFEDAINIIEKGILLGDQGVMQEIELLNYNYLPGIIDSKEITIELQNLIKTADIFYDSLIINAYFAEIHYSTGNILTSIKYGDIVENLVKSKNLFLRI